MTRGEGWSLLAISHFVSKKCVLLMGEFTRVLFGGGFVSSFGVGS